jgi:hypothetical protein
MVVVLSTDDYKDAVSQIIERDYFPPCDNIGNNNNNTDTDLSLTTFHQRTTDETTNQLHESLQTSANAIAHKQSLIYQSPIGTCSTAAELRNGLFFPISTTDTCIVPVTTTTSTHASSTTKSTMMMMLPPPPRKRQRPDVSLNQNDIQKDENCSLTTLDTAKIASKRNAKSSNRSTQWINASGTRFPVKTNRRRVRSTRNCYSANHTEHHWEGSTKCGSSASTTGDDNHSAFTDLDATTVDSYSIRSELHKATVATTKHKGLKPTIKANTAISCDSQSDSNSVGMTLPIAYQLPQESHRDRIASTIGQVRTHKTQSTMPHHKQLRQGPHSNGTKQLQQRHVSRRSIGSLRSALRASHRSSDQRTTQTL